MKLQHTWTRRLLTLVCVLAVCAIALISCNTDKTPDEVVPDNNIPNDSTTSEHEHTLVVDEAIAATCSKEGRTSGVHCSECQEVILAQQIVSKLAHTVVIDEGVPATYEKTGLTTGAHCATCGEILVVQQTIPKLEENPGDGGENPDNPGGDVPEFTGCPEVHTKANLDTNGIKYEMLSQHMAEFCEDSTYTLYRCAFCNKYFADDIIPAAGAKCDWEVTTEATCAVEGVMTCKVCHYAIKTGKDTSPSAHEWKYDVACGDVAQKTNRICMICGIVETDLPVMYIHAWTKIEVIEEPTCGVDGKAVYTCTNCGVTKTLEIIADAYNAGHNWVYGEAQVGDCAKHKDTVLEGYYCKDCGISAEVGQEIIVNGNKVINKSMYRVIPYEHDEIKQTLVVSSCTEEGSTLIKCRNCSYYELVKEDAFGHHWERPGNDRLDYSKLTKTNIACYAATETVGKYVYTYFCADCGKDIEIKSEGHVITKDKYIASTCTDKGYTCDYCETCRVAFNIKIDDTAPLDPDNHSWCGPNDIELLTHPDWYVVITHPTCTKPGVATSVCKLCGIVRNENVPVAPTHHDYYQIDPITGQIVTDADGKAILLRPYYDCSIGKIVYTCTVCAAKPEAEREVNWKLFEDIEGFDYNDPASHVDCGGIVSVVVGDPRNNAGDCENDKVTVYTCDKHIVYIVHNEGKQHSIDPVTLEAAMEPTCDTKGQVGYEQCTKCNYKKGIYSWKGGLIEQLGHDWDPTTYVEPVAPTCTTDGSLGYGVCLRENCNKVVGEKSELKRVIPALGHSMILVEDVNPDANNGFEWAITCTKYAYRHFICEYCDYECWRDYVPATGHNLDYRSINDMPTCTQYGVLTCQNANCGYGFTTYTEIVAKLPHIDPYGNEIHCINEDFYCFECCGPIFDATTGKFTGKYTAAPIDARESHVDVTTVISPNVCGGYYYTIYVCNRCGEFWNEGDMGYVDHYVSNDHWKVISVATPSAPGVEALICERCGAIVETREIAYTG